MKLYINAAIYLIKLDGRSFLALEISFNIYRNIICRCNYNFRYITFNAKIL